MAAMKQNGEKYQELKIKSPHTGWPCKTKASYWEGHFCSPWTCLGGLWSPITWVLVCLYNLCQRLRQSLKTLGMQLKNQQSRVDCIESGAALDLQDIGCLLSAQFLSSWVTLSNHWNICLWDADNIRTVRSEEPGWGLSLFHIPCNIPPKSFLICPCYPAGCSSGFSSILDKGGHFPTLLACLWLIVTFTTLPLRSLSELSLTIVKHGNPYYYLPWSLASCTKIRFCFMLFST